eukprot:c13014_g1_i2.p1 GENE.c13014_g1_i2~~c13014_g1_i2.p1  ORF type:complete len:844 (+),score=222.52 c13014_g1_i2:116-2533(+)
MYELGFLGLIQLSDLNSHLNCFARPFASQISRCEEAERQMRSINLLLKQHNVKASDVPGSVPRRLTLDDVEVAVAEAEAPLREAAKHIEELTVRLSKYLTRRDVLTKCDAELFVGVEFGPASRAEGAPNNFIVPVCGAVPQERASVLERILFRVTRGHCIIRWTNNSLAVTDPRTKEKANLKVFAVFVLNPVRPRVLKVVDAIASMRVDVDSDSNSRGIEISNLAGSITEYRNILEQTQSERLELLEAAAVNFESWWTSVHREKMTLHEMNKCHTDAASSLFVAKGWTPKSDIRVMQQALDDVCRRCGHGVAVVTEVVPNSNLDSRPPTYFTNNALTKSFQKIVDAYGVARYQEINPTPFTVISFPFLFAVMFGDVGHGFLLLILALYMIKREKYYDLNKPGEMFGMCFSGRYVMLLMGIFSMYVGALYNETFSLPINAFGSAYSFHKTILADNTTLVTTNMRGVYPFGMDPVWKTSRNELSFTNAFKMKMSVVFGVFHMACGICLSAFNAHHSRDFIALFNLVLPQFLFLLSIFGYLVLLIIVKWATHYKSTHCAPSILSTLISMFLSLGNVPPVDSNPETNQGCNQDNLINGQAGFQKFLLFVAFVSVPWMLLVKPLILRHRQNTIHSMARGRSTVVPRNRSNSNSRNSHEQQNNDTTNNNHNNTNNNNTHGHGAFDFAEEMIHSVIHTIEFVLGTISNTASYLRLWALSLAHGQLSTVFWERCIVGPASSKSWPSLVIGYFVWVCCTLGVLMVMESLSAFLHALRLHWVEFQNKFYVGDGIKFRPFRFEKHMTVENYQPHAD